MVREVELDAPEPAGRDAAAGEEAVVDEQDHVAAVTRREGEHDAGGDTRAIAVMGADADIRRQFLKRRDRQWQSGDHARLPRHQDGVGRSCLRDGGDRGDVAGAAEILVQRALHGLVDDERRQKRFRVQ